MSGTYRQSHISAQITLVEALLQKRIPVFCEIYFLIPKVDTEDCWRSAEL